MTLDNESVMKTMKDLNLSQDELSRFTTAFKDKKFKDMFMDYVNEISDPQNKEALENHIKQCESNQNPKDGGKKFSMEDKELLIPYPDFCIKTYETKTSQKVFINICYCEKIENCIAFDDPIRRGTEWKIPYSLGGPSKEKDKAKKECLVFDYIVGTETHKKANETKQFKQFLISTAIEAIEKMKNVQLDKKYSLPLLKYKGKKDSKEPRMFTIKKKSTAKNTQNSSKKNVSEQKLESKIVLQPPAQERNIAKETTSNVDIAKEVEPPHEVIYSNKVNYDNCWSDTQLSTSNTTPEAIVLRVDLAEVVNAQDIILDIEESQVILRVPEKYKLKVKLKYNVNKLQSNAQWKKHIHQLVVRLPIDSKHATNK